MAGTATPLAPLTKGGKRSGPFPLGKGELGGGPAVRNRASTALAPFFLLVWLILPPLELYIYARVAQPIFGQSRYTLFVARRSWSWSPWA